MEVDRVERMVYLGVISVRKFVGKEKQGDGMRRSSAKKLSKTRRGEWLDQIGG